ncbi:integrase core domain-containing protein [Mesorhizobium sp. LCM 4577]|uniref:integrase core domain-containing protein n=1 Tax=unclassified Mesorhizobium TaxID=325217 RepID=UPI00352A945C
MLLLQCRTSIRSLLRSGAVFPINGRLSLRDERLNNTLFSTLSEGRNAVTSWKEDHNHPRPH